MEEDQAAVLPGHQEVADQLVLVLELWPAQLRLHVEGAEDGVEGGQGDGLQLGERAGQDLAHWLEGGDAGEHQAEGQVVHLGQTLREALEAARLEVESAALDEVQHQLDVEEAAPGLDGEEPGELLHGAGLGLLVAAPGARAPRQAEGGVHPGPDVVSHVLVQPLVHLRVVQTETVGRNLKKYVQYVLKLHFCPNLIQLSI